jgi:biotin--protein ligase
MTQILVYADQGVDGGALKQLIHSLKREIDLSEHAIKRIDAKKLTEEDWEKEAKLLIIPGGRDVFYHAALNGRGTEKIRSFVREGGGYLGICAGAYFAADRIEFEKGQALEVCGARSLKFFPGVAKGPAYGNNKYSYECTQGVEAAHISWGAETCHVYFNGGCTFESAEHMPEMLTLSRYLDLASTPPAIVQIAFGKGTAVLSGVHFEYNSSLFPNEDPHLAKISPFLKNAERNRRKIFREIMAFYGLKLSL